MQDHFVIAKFVICFLLMERARLQASICAVSLALFASSALFAQNVRVVKFSESDPFKMGTVTSRRIVHPGHGAKKTTLNLSVSEPGAEFAQHTHGESTDTILVLEGEVNLRQGPGLHLFKAGEFAFVPVGQIHGTVTAGTGPAVMISFQNPPDLVLYTGARDSSKANAAPPKGDITPGAVKYGNFREKNGEFVGKQQGASLVAAFHRKLKKGETFRTSVSGDGEALLFVWKGAIRVKDGRKEYQAGERDTVFVQGDAQLEVIGDDSGTAEIIHVQAPPAKAK